MARNIKDINVEIGARVKQLRMDRKLTREKFGKLSGYTANFIQEVERGRSGLSSESIRAFAVALGVSTDMILFGEVNNEYGFVTEKLKEVPADKLPHVLMIINGLPQWPGLFRPAYHYIWPPHGQRHHVTESDGV